MTPDLGFAYAQARIQARFAGLPMEEEWQRLEPSRTLASFLEDARTGALRDWVKGFSGQSGVHELESGMRSLFLEISDEVRGWVPVAWREAVSWIGLLIRLPLLAHLGTGGTAPAWVAKDPELGILLGEDGRFEPRGSAAVELECLTRTDDGLALAWIEQWRLRWPRCGRETSRSLSELIALLRQHTEVFVQTAPESAWGLRKDLRERLRLRLHLRTLQPDVPFLFLALAALDLERLRAALVSRALFPARDQHVSLWSRHPSAD